MNQPTPAREHAATTLPLGSTVFGFTVTSKKTLAELDADAYVLHKGAPMNQPTPAREHAATTLPLGSTVFGFTVTSKKTLAELDADAYVLHHHASGARLLYLACEDENKAFSIAFKTPPTDDTGVFHILEHSVLCGSHHHASGARLLYLACEDENKAFSIAFKTPPTDDTGVFHILEHSVLCGSAKLPDCSISHARTRTRRSPSHSKRRPPTTRASFTSSSTRCCAALRNSR